MSQQQQTRIAYCNEFGNDREHTVVYAESQIAYDRELGNGEQYWLGTTYRMALQCPGCRTLQTLYLFDEGHEQHETHYPPREPRRLPAWAGSVRFADDDVAFVPRLLREIYGALQHGYHRLAACGVRALIEQLAIQQNGGDKGSFAKNLGYLLDAGGLSVNQHKRVMDVIEAGSATIHRGHVPNQDEVMTMLDIVEHVIHSTYLHPQPVEELAKRTPARPPRAPK